MHFSRWRCTGGKMPPDRHARMRALQLGDEALRQAQGRPFDKLRAGFRASLARTRMLCLTSAVHERQNAALTGTDGCVCDTDVRCTFIQAHSADSVAVVKGKRSKA